MSTELGLCLSMHWEVTLSIAAANGGGMADEEGAFESPEYV